MGGDGVRVAWVPSQWLDDYIDRWELAQYAGCNARNGVIQSWIREGLPAVSVHESERRWEYWFPRELSRYWVDEYVENGKLRRFRTGNGSYLDRKWATWPPRNFYPVWNDNVHRFELVDAADTPRCNNPLW